jgi:hypothetical protein
MHQIKEQGFLLELGIVLNDEIESMNDINCFNIGHYFSVQYKPVITKIHQKKLLALFYT